MTKRIPVLLLALVICLSLWILPASAEEWHTVTVIYEMPEGCETPAPEPFTFTGAPGEPYSVTSPQVSGFAPDMVLVYGMIGEDDETITVRYYPIVYVVYVQYNVPEGYTAPKSVHKTGSPGAKYSFAVPEVANLIPDREKVEGEFGAKDETIEVTYYEDNHTVTVKYTVPEGYTAPPDGRATGLKGTEYNIESPAIDGLKPDKTAVTGTFASEDVNDTVTYTEGDHTVTVKYVVPAGYEAHKPNDRTITAAFGTYYSFNSPDIANLRADQATVAGKIGHTDETITVNYAETGRTITIDFNVPDGYSRPKPVVMTKPVGSTYSYQAPELEGLEVDHREASGTVGNKDISVLFTYTPIQYHTVTVHYVNEFGDEMYTPRIKQGLKYGDKYSFDAITAAHFRPDKSQITGTMYDMNVTETFTYSHYTYNTEWHGGSGECAHPEDKVEEWNPSYDGAHYHMVEQYCRQCRADRNVYRIPCTDENGDGFCDYCSQNLGERDDGYTLTVNYVVPEGYTAPAPAIKKSFSGSQYFIPSPTIEGLVPDKAIVQGSFSSNTTITVTYYEAHRLTIHYVLPDGYLKSRSYDEVLLYKKDERYVVSSPTFSDLAANPGVVIGTMGSQDVETTVEYYYNQSVLASFYLTINYVVPEGFTAPMQYKTQVEAGSNYYIPSPALEGLVPSMNAVQGTMGNADATVTVTYWKATNRLTINYNAPAGEAKPDSYVADIKVGDRYVVRSPRIPGYTADPFAVAGTMGNQDVTVEVGYNANPVVDASYKLTVNYTVPEAFQALKPATYTGLYSQGQPYRIQSPAVSGLVPSLETVEGVMGGDDLTVEVVYRPADDAYYYVTIHYVVPEGYTKPQDVVMTGVPGTPFCFLSPEITELAPDLTKVEGTVTNQDQEFTVTYQRVYLVWITYVVPEGFIAPAPVFYRAPTGYHYRHVSPVPDGLAFIFPSTDKVIEGTVGTENVFVRVPYKLGVALRVIYQYDGIHSTTRGDGKIQMPEPYVETFPLSDGIVFDYSVESPIINGVFTNNWTVTGTISNENVTRYVNYYDNKYTVTFICNGPEESKWNGYAVDEIKVIEGEPFEYTTRPLDGLRPVHEKYTGVMGDEDMEVTIDYEGIYHTLTINCVYPEGYTGPEKAEHQVLEKHDYNILPPEVEGLETRPVRFEGTMGTEDINVTAEYAPAYYQLTVTYEYPEDFWPYEENAEYIERLAPGEEFHITPPPVANTTVTPDRADGVMGDMDVEVNFVYSWNPVKLTVNFDLPGGYYGPRPEPIIQEHMPGTAFTVEAPVIAGLYPDQPRITVFMTGEDSEITFCYHLADPVPVSEGDGQTVNKASNGASFRMTKDHDSFSGKVWGDGKELQRGTDYTDRSGSTIIDLTESYLSKLLPGNHELAVRFQDGDAVMSFTTTYNTYTFILPSGIKTIEASTFEGNSAISVAYVPDSCTFIGAKAFKDCTGLRLIRLPKNCAIDDSAFNGCTGLIAIYGPTGGTTKTWADRNNIPFAAE